MMNFHDTRTRAEARSRSEREVFVVRQIQISLEDFKMFVSLFDHFPTALFLMSFIN